MEASEENWANFQMLWLINYLWPHIESVWMVERPSNAIRCTRMPLNECEQLWTLIECDWVHVNSIEWGWTPLEFDWVTLMWIRMIECIWPPPWAWWSVCEYFWVSIDKVWMHASISQIDSVSSNWEWWALPSISMCNYVSFQQQ